MSGFQIHRAGPQRFVVTHPTLNPMPFEFRSVEEASDFKAGLQMIFGGSQ